MVKNIKKIGIFLFMLCALCVAYPSTVQAERTAPSVFIDEADILAANGTDFVPGQYRSEKQAVSEFRAQMLKRRTSIILKVKSESEDAGSLFNKIYAAVLEEDEKTPEAGDYLKQNIRSLSLQGSYAKPENDKNFYYTFEICMSYYTTEAQEKYVNSGVKSIISGLKLSAKADDDKIKAIYDYVTSHVTYDRDSLVTDNPLSHTAYSALSKGKAVCQGYTSLVYRLMREADIPVRVITGKAMQSNGDQVSHAWNIVKINGKWYYMDATWDASLSGGNDQKYQYFLKNAKEFSDHLPENEFKTSQFMSKHPISSTSYPKYQSALKKVTGVKAVKRNETSVTLSWSKLSGIKYYKVALYSASTNTYIVKATVASNSATIKGLKGGTKYQMLVLAYDKASDTLGPANTPFTVWTNPGKVSPVKVSTAAKSITYTWKKVSPCTGYELQYSTNSKFTGSTTKKVNISKNASSKKITALKSNKKYYIRIRAYLTVDNKKQYGSWSTVKSIKCK